MIRRVSAFLRPQVSVADVDRRIEAAQADVLAILDQVLDDEAGLARITERHLGYPPPCLSPDRRD
jgi:hypothetical protein